MNHILYVFKDWIWGKMEFKRKKPWCFQSFLCRLQVKEQSSCPVSHLGSGQRSLNSAGQGPTNTMRQPGTTNITINKTESFTFCLIKPLWNSNAGGRLPEVTKGSCLLCSPEPECFNSYKELLFRTGCHCHHISNISRYLCHHPGKKQILAQMLFIYRGLIYRGKSVSSNNNKKKIQVKTMKLNTYIEISMYLHQNTAHVWEGHSEPYYALLRWHEFHNSEKQSGQQVPRVCQKRRWVLFLKKLIHKNLCGYKRLYC